MPGKSKHGLNRESKCKRSVFKNIQSLLWYQIFIRIHRERTEGTDRVFLNYLAFLILKKSHELYASLGLRPPFS